MLRTLPLALLALLSNAHAASIERIWLSHQRETPSHITVNWETDTPSDSVVEYGTTSAYGQQVAVKESVTLHHVEIPVTEPDAVVHYRVRSGDKLSADATFKSQPTQELRVVIVGDWGYAKAEDLSAIVNENAHLLLSAGDNVASLHEKGREGTKAFSALIDRQPALFRAVPFMPILGNHDREITSRGPGPKPPAHPVYDVEAKAYREFFALPGDEWKWTFDLSGFDLRFVALDLNHIQDFGTNWQTCHPWQADSEQFLWYRDLMKTSSQGFMVTLINERQSNLNGLTKGAWHHEMKQGSALVSGFGYFAEYAELADGLPYFNTCLKGDGSPYKDPKSKFFTQQDNYLLLTFQKGSTTFTTQIKNLKGETLHTQTIERRKR